MNIFVHHMYVHSPKRGGNMTKVKKNPLKQLIKDANAYIHKYPAVVYGWITVISTFLVKRYPNIPNELIVITILSMFGLSKQVQKVEDKKTEEALYTDPPK